MIKYILVSKKFEGYLVLGYNKSNGYLVHFQNCSFGMTDKQMQAICENLGYMLTNEGLKAAAKEWGHVLISVAVDLSFDRFWTVFDNPRNRHKCEPKWNKKTVEEKQYILYSAEACLWYCAQNKGWYNQVLPETFLDGDWRSEWYKMEKKNK